MAASAGGKEGEIRENEETKKEAEGVRRGERDGGSEGGETEPLGLNFLCRFFFSPSGRGGGVREEEGGAALALCLLT